MDVDFLSRSFCVIPTLELHKDGEVYPFTMTIKQVEGEAGEKKMHTQNVAAPTNSIVDKGKYLTRPSAGSAHFDHPNGNSPNKGMGGTFHKSRMSEIFMLL